MKEWWLNLIERAEGAGFPWSVVWWATYFYCCWSGSREHEKRN